VSRARRIVAGSPERIAGTVYGTIVVMGSIAAGAEGDPDASTVAAIVTATVLVLWIAHVYSHALADTVARDRRIDRAELASVAAREFSIPLAAVAPVAALLLGAVGVLRESTAIWLAMAIGLVTLAAQGLRYAEAERLGRLGTLVSVGVNLAFGLVIVGLKAAVVH
jgi:hypothetical protein